MISPPLITRPASGCRTARSSPRTTTLPALFGAGLRAGLDAVLRVGAMAVDPFHDGGRAAGNVGEPWVEKGHCTARSHVPRGRAPAKRLGACLMQAHAVA